MIPLQLLQTGEPAVVLELDGPDTAVHRLREMGVEPGVEIEIVQSGSPCIVRINEQRLCLRFDDSITIFVTPAPCLGPRPDPAAHRMPRLNELKEGQRDRILDVDGDDSIAVRLLEMGLTPEEEIGLIGFAPLGDPIEFEIRGYRLSLRSSEARRVEVELLP